MVVGNVIGATVPLLRYGKWEDRYKLFLCVCPMNGWYFYINSENHWDGSFPLPQQGNPVDKDCFVGCGHLQEVDDDVFAGRRPFGKISSASLQALAQFIPTVRILTDEEKDLIIRNLLGAA